jgi:hypothetical protein
MGGERRWQFRNNIAMKSGRESTFAIRIRIALGGMRGCETSSQWAASAASAMVSLHRARRKP